MVEKSKNFMQNIHTQSFGQSSTYTYFINTADILYNLLKLYYLNTTT